MIDQPPSELTPLADTEIRSNLSITRNTQPSPDTTPFEPSRVFDRLLNTCLTSLSEGEGNSAWLKLHLGEMYKVNSVIVHSVFYDDWFFYPPKRSDCHSSLAEFQVSKFCFKKALFGSQMFYILQHMTVLFSIDKSYLTFYFITGALYNGSSNFNYFPRPVKQPK